jgi:hypothetical protein
MVSLSGPRALLVSLLSVFLAASTLCGCSLRIQQSVPQLDRVAGKGPLLLIRSDDTNSANQFFMDTLGSSEALRLLVREHGAPDAISLEREFLQPTRLRLFYSSQSQVYVCVNQDGRWFVVGVEPPSDADTESLGKQRLKQSQTVAELNTPPQAPAPLVSAPVTAPVARVIEVSDFRGQLKPPALAGVAPLSRGSRGYIHQVSFAGETLYSLADWFTEDPRNAVALARSSQREITTPLHMGDRIVIPESLMRNPEPFPEALAP